MRNKRIKKNLLKKPCGLLCREWIKFKFNLVEIIQMDDQNLCRKFTPCWRVWWKQDYFYAQM